MPFFRQKIKNFQGKELILLWVKISRHRKQKTIANKKTYFLHTFCSLFFPVNVFFTHWRKSINIINPTSSTIHEWFRPYPWLGLPAFSVQISPRMSVFLFHQEGAVSTSNSAWPSTSRVRIVECIANSSCFSSLR